MFLQRGKPQTKRALKTVPGPGTPAPPSCLHTSTSVASDWFSLLPPDWEHDWGIISYVPHQHYLKFPAILESYFLLLWLSGLKDPPPSTLCCISSSCGPIWKLSHHFKTCICMRMYEFMLFFLVIKCDQCSKQLNLKKKNTNVFSLWLCESAENVNSFQHAFGRLQLELSSLYL